MSVRTPEAAARRGAPRNADDDLENFFEHAAMPMHWVGADGSIVRANQAELDLLGYAREEYVGRNIAEFHADAHVIEDILRRLKGGETLRDYPARLRRKDGALKDVRITSNVRWQDGAFVHTRCFTRDISQTVDYLEGLLEGFVAYDSSWVMTYMNAAAERLLGRARAEVLGRTWHQAFPHAVGNPVDQMYQRVMRSRQAERMEYYYPHYGRWLEISASPVRNGGVAVYFRDISDRETLNRIGRTLASELDLGRLVQAVTDAATEVSGAQFGAFFYNQKNRAGESYLLYTLSGARREDFERFGTPRNTGVFAPTFAGEGIVRSADITRDPRYGRNAPHRGMPQGHLPVRSYLAVPVVLRSGEVLGGLFFGHPEPGVFGERAERLVAGIAAQAAIAMDNARLYRAVQESEQRFRALADSAPVLIWVNGTEGCEYVNRSYAEFFGIAESEVLGDNWTRLVHPEDREGYLRDYGAAMLEQRQFEGDVRLRRSDGEWRWMRSIGIPRLSAEGKLIGDAGCAVDITEVKKAGEELRGADRRKDEFLAMLAHELRNPLAPLRNGLHLLRVSPPGSEQSESARAMMERQLGHLIRLVDDLLEVSRVSRGKIGLRCEPLDLAVAAQSALEASRPAIEAARHRLDVSLPAAPLMLHGDLVRLSQVIANLLNNAAKYTEPGGRVALAVKREGDTAVVSVRDSGIGITAKLLPRVFEMFAQADRGRAQGGLGIGLALARSLVEMHGGRIEAKSDGPGQGAEFVVRLPLQREAG